MSDHARAAQCRLLAAAAVMLLLALQRTAASMPADMMVEVDRFGRKDVNCSVDSNVGQAHLPVSMEASNLAVGHDGLHVYALDGWGSENVVHRFERNSSTGFITFVDSLTVPVDLSDHTVLHELKPRPVVSSDDRYLYATGVLASGGGLLVVVDVSGSAMTQVQVVDVSDVSGAPGFTAGPKSVLLAPDGNHMYLASKLDDFIAVFARNQSTGVLTFVERVEAGDGSGAVLDGPVDIECSPDGATLYVADLDGGMIETFHRDGTSGHLTRIGALSEIAGTPLHPEPMAISPDGHDLYVPDPDPTDPYYRGVLHHLKPQVDGSFVVADTSDAWVKSPVVSGDGLLVHALSGYEVGTFRRDPETGVLGPLQLGAVGSTSGGSTTLAVVPNADAVYLTSYCGDLVSMQHVRVACSAEPTPTCMRGSSGKGQIKIRIDYNRPAPWTWSWRSDASVLMSLLGDVQTTTDTVVCLYGEQNFVPQYITPAGGACNGRPCWKGSVYAGKLLYRDSMGTPSGVTNVHVAGDRLLVKFADFGWGATFFYNLPFHIQLQTSTDACIEDFFSAPYTFPARTYRSRND